MTTQPEALRLAECLDEPLYVTHKQMTDAAAELRRLHAENDRLQSRYEAYRIAACQWLDKTEWIQKTVRGSELGMHRADVVRQRLLAVEAQRKPLTDEEIGQRYYVSTGQMLREQDKRLAFLFARAIERAHGIKE